MNKKIISKNGKKIRGGFNLPPNTQGGLKRPTAPPKPPPKKK